MAKKTPVKVKPKAATVRQPLLVWSLVVLAVVLVSAVALVYVLSRNAKKAVAPAPTPAAGLRDQISADDAFFIFGESGVTFLDIRPAVEWKAYHIDKSINIPATELKGRLAELPTTGTIVIFDKSGGEQAHQSFDLLQQSGFQKVTSVKGGMDAWLERRYPIVGTAPY